MLKLLIKVCLNLLQPVMLCNLSLQLVCTIFVGPAVVTKEVSLVLFQTARFVLCWGSIVICNLCMLCLSYLSTMMVRIYFYDNHFSVVS